MSQNININIKKYVSLFVTPRARRKVKNFISQTVWKVSPTYRSNLRIEKEINSLKLFQTNVQAEINKLQREFFGIKEILDENVALHTDSMVVVLERQAELLGFLEKRLLKFDQERKSIKMSVETDNDI